MPAPCRGSRCRTHVRSGSRRWPSSVDPVEGRHPMHSSPSAETSSAAPACVSSSCLQSAEPGAGDESGVPTPSQLADEQPAGRRTQLHGRTCPAAGPPALRAPLRGRRGRARARGAARVPQLGRRLRAWPRARPARAREPAGSGPPCLRGLRRGRARDGCGRPRLSDWLDANSLPDGGLPFALPIAEPSGCAPFWANADPDAFSLQITAIVAANANRAAEHDPAFAAHPWVAHATDRCLGAIDALEAAPAAYELAFALRFLDAVSERHDTAVALLARLAEYIPKDGHLRVSGGLSDEALRPVDLAPEPGRPARAILDDASVERDLERLAGEQRDDGGWSVDFQSYSPAAEIDWRGYATVRALSVLRENGVF